MDKIVDKDARTVARCPYCDRTSDIYYECDVVQKWIDVALLRRRAWAHILFNEDLFLTSIYVSLFCSFLEAFVAHSNAVLREQTVSSSSDSPLTPPSLNSVQLVRIIKGPYFSFMNYTRSIPLRTFFAVEEYIFMSVGASCMGNIVRPHSSYSFRRWLYVVSVANLSKLCYMIFITFMTPSSLLPIVDLIFFFWLAQGFRTLLRDQPQVMTFMCVFMCAFARFLLRLTTGWAPQFLSS